MNALKSPEYFRSFDGQLISRTLQDLVGEKAHQFFFTCIFKIRIQTNNLGHPRRCVVYQKMYFKLENRKLEVTGGPGFSFSSVTKNKIETCL